MKTSAMQMEGRECQGGGPGINIGSELPIQKLVLKNYGIQIKEFTLGMPPNQGVGPWISSHTSARHWCPYSMVVSALATNTVGPGMVLLTFSSRISVVLEL